MKIPEALPIRQLISVSNDAFDATLEPSYTKFFTSILIDGGISVPWLKTLVSLRPMVRPESEHAYKN